MDKISSYHVVSLGASVPVLAPNLILQKSGSGALRVGMAAANLEKLVGLEGVLERLYASNIDLETESQVAGKVLEERWGCPLKQKLDATSRRSITDQAARPAGHFINRLLVPILVDDVISRLLVPTVLSVR